MAAVWKKIAMCESTNLLKLTFEDAMPFCHLVFV
jgi:hypothetical protein